MINTKVKDKPMEVDEISDERKEAEDRIPERSKKRIIERKRGIS